MQHTRSPLKKAVWISSSRFPPILSSPCSTKRTATTPSTIVWRRAVTVFRPLWFGDPVSLLRLWLIIDLAPSSLPSSCIHSSLPHAPCLHKCYKELRNSGKRVSVVTLFLSPFSTMLRMLVFIIMIFFDAHVSSENSVDSITSSMTFEDFINLNYDTCFVCYCCTHEWRCSFMFLISLRALLLLIVSHIDAYCLQRCQHLLVCHGAE